MSEELRRVEAQLKTAGELLDALRQRADAQVAYITKLESENRAMARALKAHRTGDPIELAEATSAQRETDAKIAEQYGRDAEAEPGPTPICRVGFTADEIAAAIRASKEQG